IGRQDVVYPKPHPEPILKALSKLGHVKTDKCWMVGDTCMDMKAAKAASIDGIGVTCGYSNQKVLEKCTDHIRENQFIIA
ncbi:MAG: HAD family hydrolase, partial [Sulfurovum sp.]